MSTRKSLTGDPHLLDTTPANSRHAIPRATNSFPDFDLSEWEAQEAEETDFERRITWAACAFLITFVAIVAILK